MTDHAKRIIVDSASLHFAGAAFSSSSRLVGNCGYHETGTCLGSVLAKEVVGMVTDREVQSSLLNLG